MSFSIGIVGLPNVGKSTLFKALTKKQVPAENFPFCTIDPNIGIVEVPDERLLKLTQISKSEKTIPTAIEFVDIAGLVKGAHKGEGLGNKFLSHIREVDAIAHVVRDFENSNIQHVENSVDAKRDKEIILLELIMADLATVEKRLKDAHSQAKGGDKIAIKAVSALEKIKAQLDSEHMASDANLSDEEKFAIRDLQLLTQKPILTVVNVAEEDANREPKNENEIIISAKIESELAELSDEDARAMLKDLGMNQSGLDKLITASYRLLNLITFLTSGPQESRAWTVENGSTAPQAAGKIHTDFEKGFIRAEVIGYDDFVKYNGELGAKEAGKMNLEGKEYIMQDGDICHFLHN
ncbi:MAG: redox-regulated ATPase YchF [Parcubacteria group bacterium CG11_big_fil_rev_8_21_14_0_20_41_14]|nr:MAG: redox-regulated ATPase YchF [Parcubacteria group bacterium CG11_big_fil_rev_8_21_14_0_20_41_14]